MDQSLSQNTPMGSQGVDGTLAGEPLSFYWRISAVPIIVLLAAEIVLWYAELPAYATRIAEVVILFAFSWYVMRKRKGHRAAAFASAYAALVAGILIALFELIADVQFWRVFNFIARPLWMAAMGLVVGAISGISIIRFFNSSKGGEQHG